MTRITQTFAIDATTTVYNKRFCEDGFARMLIVNAGSLTNAVTITVDVKDSAGYVVWTKSAINKNAITRFDPFSTDKFDGVPIDMNGSVSVTLSGAAGGTGGSITVVLYVDASRSPV